MTPYYDEGGITIYHGRCEEILPDLADESVDIAVTSPPYNMGLTPGGGGRGMYRPSGSRKGGRFRQGYDGDNDDALPYDEYCAWQRDVLAESWRVSRHAVFYNHRPRVEHGKLRLPLDYDYGVLGQPRQVIIWNRGTGIDVNLRNFCTRQEWIIFFARDEFKLVDHAASGMGDVWDLGMETGQKDHPAPFPIALPARCLAASGARSVLDPFAGSGTTLRAAKDIGARAIGIEKLERFCEMAALRMGQEVLAL